MSGALEIRDVSVMRGTKTVVDAVSIRVEPGKTVALLGPNGAGKSSLVLALAGALPIVSGRVSVGERQVSGLRAAPDPSRRNRRRAGGPSGADAAYRPRERGGRGRHASACRAAAERGARLRHLPRAPRACASAQPASLSGGEQQMLALAQALIAAPKFLLADEMSLGLAPIVVRRLMTCLEGHREGGDWRPPDRAVHACRARARRPRLRDQPRTNPLRGKRG